MGQYHFVINLDKREYLYPHKLGDGLKLREFGRSGNGTMTALAILLADSNGRGGGDFHIESDLVGSWAGDRITIAGDYGDPGKYIPDKSGKNLYDIAREEFTDISDDIRKAMEQDHTIEMDKSWLQ